MARSMLTTCYQCGKTIQISNCGEWKFKRVDNRKDSETYRRTIWFCTDGCKNAFEKAYPSKRYNKW